jgi:hypothetical protein
MRSKPCLSARLPGRSFDNRPLVCLEVICMGTVFILRQCRRGGGALLIFGWLEGHEVEAAIAVVAFATLIVSIHAERRLSRLSSMAFPGVTAKYVTTHRAGNRGDGLLPMAALLTPYISSPCRACPLSGPRRGRNGLTALSCVMPDPRLPIKVLRAPRGAEIRLATGERLYVYGREPEIARAAKSLTRDQAEQLAKDVARALTSVDDAQSRPAGRS